MHLRRLRSLGKAAAFGCGLAIALGSVCDATANADGAARDSRGEILTKGQKLYSQGNEELVIRHFFNDRRDGVFLDVGAFHWKNYSTTLYLEERLGWSGIAIDAQAKYGQGYADNRPRTKFLSYLVSDHSDGVDDFYVSGAISSRSKEHIRKLSITKDHEPTRIEVPTITLNDLLERLGVQKIDLLSMDIEGSEPPALRGFDIERYRPELVCIEAVIGDDREVGPYFEEHGYERIDEYLKYDVVNWYYKPRS